MDALIKSLRPGKPSDIKPSDVKSPEVRPAELDPAEFLAAAVRADQQGICLLYTSDAADDLPRVDLGGRRVIKNKKPLTDDAFPGLTS